MPLKPTRAMAAYTSSGATLLMEKNTIYGEDCRPLIVESSVNLDTLEDWDEAEKMLLEKQL